jgi:hypothetical protein
MIDAGPLSELWSLVRYLNKHYPAKESVRLMFIPGCDCLETGPDEKVWSCYDPNKKMIIIPGDKPQIPGADEYEIDIYYAGNLVHEYIHQLQSCEVRPFDDEEAERRASEIMEEWLRENQWDAFVERIKAKVKPGTKRPWSLAEVFGDMGAYRCKTCGDITVVQHRCDLFVCANGVCPDSDLERICLGTFLVGDLRGCYFEIPEDLVTELEALEQRGDAEEDEA